MLCLSAYLIICVYAYLMFDFLPYISSLSSYPLILLSLLSSRPLILSSSCPSLLHLTVLPSYHLILSALLSLHLILLILLVLSSYLISTHRINSSTLYTSQLTSLPAFPVVRSCEQSEQNKSWSLDARRSGCLGVTVSQQHEHYY